MKLPFLLPGLLLCSLGVARAQQPTTAPDTVRVTRLVYTAPPPPMLTAADTARELARLENARRLRQTANDNAGSMASTPSELLPVKVKEGELGTPHTASRKVLAKDARRREEANRKGAQNEKKRAKTLYKRAKKSS